MHNSTATDHPTWRHDPRGQLLADHRWRQEGDSQRRSATGVERAVILTCHQSADANRIMRMQVANFERHQFGDDHPDHRVDTYDHDVVIQTFHATGEAEACYLSWEAIDVLIAAIELWRQEQAEVQRQPTAATAAEELPY